MTDFRPTLIAHVLTMREHDEDYARSALAWYADLLPWAQLNSGVRAALSQGLPELTDVAQS